jgi:hypothetical protein
VVMWSSMRKTFIILTFCMASKWLSFAINRNQRPVL